MAQQMTAVFNCDLRKFEGNPHTAATPFGTATMLTYGNQLERNSHLEDLLERCADFLEDYSDVVDGDYGQPEPNTAMRLIASIRAAITA